MIRVKTCLGSQAITEQVGHSEWSDMERKPTKLFPSQYPRSSSGSDFKLQIPIHVPLFFAVLSWIESINCLLAFILLQLDLFITASNSRYWPWLCYRSKNSNIFRVANRSESDVTSTAQSSYDTKLKQFCLLSITKVNPMHNLLSSF